MTAIKYTPELAERFYRECCSGKSNKEIAAEMLVRAEIFNDWANDPDKPEFRDAYELGKQAQEAFWEQQGRINLDNPRFKESLYKFITGVRFNWSEKSEQTVKNNNAPASEAELDQLIKDKLKALGLSESDVKPE
jgi:hypothetical protein